MANLINKIGSGLNNANQAGYSALNKYDPAGFPAKTGRKLTDIPGAIGGALKTVGTGLRNEGRRELTGAAQAIGNGIYKALPKAKNTLDKVADFANKKVNLPGASGSAIIKTVGGVSGKWNGKLNKATASVPQQPAAAGLAAKIGGKIAGKSFMKHYQDIADFK